MNIEEVSKDDFGKLKQLARSVILESVDASIDIKREIVLDTESHIDRHLVGADRVFFK